jgi:DNA polymerase III alpha subunit
LFKELELGDVLRCLIYVVDTMKAKRVTWGVGRGSSCSSYLLYLLDLHSVDAVKYDIDITDFIKLQGN